MKRMFPEWIGVISLVVACAAPSTVAAENQIKLPKPSFTGKTSVEAAMIAKKSVRNFTGKPLKLQGASQLLWAANGNIPADAVSGATTKVTPSAGGLYPLEIFFVTGQDTVKGVPAGTYMYDPANSSLALVASGDNRALLAHACLSQMWLARAPAIIVISAVIPRTIAKYGGRGYQYVWIEAGSANENVYLQAESLGLHVATVGAFNDAQVCSVLKLPKDTTPLLVMPVGN
jgi:SagB-type dehydrogenase family enzyme